MALTVADTIAVGDRPTHIAADEWYAYLNHDSLDTVTVLDLSARNVEQSGVAAGSDPGRLTVDGNRVYVANNTSAGGVTVLDANTFTLVDTFDTTNYPSDVAIGDGYLVVAGSQTGYLQVFDAATLNYVDGIDVGGAWRVAVGGGYAVVTGVSTNSVTVVDLSSKSIAATIPGLDRPNGVAVRNGHAFVTHGGGSGVSKIDLSTFTVVGTIGGFGSLYDLTADDHSLYAPDRTRDELVVIDQSTLTVGSRTPVGGAPSGVAVASGYAYVTNYDDDSVSVVELNSPPNAPTLTTPPSGATLDRSVTQRFRWIFNDPDSGDTQSQYDLRHRVVGAPSWTTVMGVTPNTSRDFPAGTFAEDDYEWQVRTYDAQGERGPWSSSEFFTAATPPPGPTITAPTNGATVGLSEVLVEWSYPSQEAYRLQVQDGAGNTLTDTGQVNSTTARSYLVDLPTNNVTRTVRLQVLDGGLWSAWVAVTFEVSYTPPPPPVVSLLPDTDDGALVVTITNPASGTGEPATSYNDVYVDDGAGEERRAVEVPTNSSWTYWLPVSGRDYAGNIRVVAVGDNGTTSSS